MNSLSPIMAASRRRLPLSLSPAMWLDASDAATLYDATSGGSLVAADGEVARWEDKSGNSRHATQATLGSRPLRKTAIQNGKDVIRFDGTSDSMTHGLTSSITSCSIFAVTKKLSDQTSFRGIISIGSSPSGSTLLSRNATSGRWGTYTTADAPANTSAGTSAFNLLCIIDNAASGGEFYFNGSSDGTWAGNSLVQTLKHVGGDASSSQWTHSDIAEILVYPTALSATNRQAVETYLSAKWAGGYDFDAADYFARIVAAGSTISSANQTAVNAFVVGCKTDGIWSAIKASCLLAGADDLTGALVPLVGTAPTNVDGLFVAGDYSRTTGLIGNGSTKYLNSNRSNNSDPQNNQHLAVYQTEATAGTLFEGWIGTGNVSARSQVFRNSGAGNVTTFFRSRNDIGSTVSAASSSVGLKGLSRSISSSVAARAEGSNYTLNHVSAAPTSASISVFGLGVSDKAASRLSFYSIGESLDLEMLDARLATYMSSLT